MSDQENDNQNQEESVSEESISEEVNPEKIASEEESFEEDSSEEDSSDEENAELESNNAEEIAEEVVEAAAEENTEEKSDDESEEETEEEVKVSVPLTDEKLKNILEAALMAMGKPMSVAQLMSLFEGDETPTTSRVKDALSQLQEECEGRGIELKEVATGYRYQSRQEYSEWIGRLWEERPAKYSRAYLETLALIAYRQPVTRAEIEEVRGVSVSSYIIKTMLEREWIRVVGHRDVPGRPSLYATTKQFLDYFNMKSLDELPSLAEIKDLDDLNPELALEEPGVESTEGQTEDSQALANQDEIEELEVQQELEANTQDSAEAGSTEEGSELESATDELSEETNSEGADLELADEAREYIESSLEEVEEAPEGNEVESEDSNNPEIETEAFTGESEHSFESVDSEEEAESDSFYQEESVLQDDSVSTEGAVSTEESVSEREVVEASIESFLNDSSDEDSDNLDSEESERQ